MTIPVVLAKPEHHELMLATKRDSRNSPQTVSQFKDMYINFSVAV